MCKETEALAQRHLVRMESLKHLEERVNGLIQLFEMARDFNECLDFSETFSVLDQKIAPELSFARGTIILLESSAKSDQRAGLCFSFGPKKREDQNLSEQFANECLKILIFQTSL